MLEGIIAGIKSRFFGKRTTLGLFKFRTLSFDSIQFEVRLGFVDFANQNTRSSEASDWDLNVQMRRQKLVLKTETSETDFWFPGKVREITEVNSR